MVLEAVPCQAWLGMTDTIGSITHTDGSQLFPLQRLLNYSTDAASYGFTAGLQTVLTCKDNQRAV